MTPSPRRGYYVAGLALLLALVMGGGAAYLHVRQAHGEGLVLFLLALVVVILGAFAVPEDRGRNGGGQ